MKKKPKTTQSDKMFLKPNASWQNGYGKRMLVFILLLVGDRKLKKKKRHGS